MRVLSLDLGTKTLGICVSDKLNIIAIPVENFEFETEEYSVAVDRVVELVKEYDVTKVLLGHPKRQDGTNSSMTDTSESFKSMLVEAINNQEVNITLFDERYSTKRGIELLEEKFKNNKDEIKKHKDVAAAYVMLMDYLSTI